MSVKYRSGNVPKTMESKSVFAICVRPLNWYLVGRRGGVLVLHINII